MSSELEALQALADIRTTDYATLIVLTAVGYDYILTFQDEVEYIWTKPWTWVSTLFVLVRYAGLFYLTTNTLIGSSFIPSAEMLCVLLFYSRCQRYAALFNIFDIDSSHLVRLTYNFLQGRVVTIVEEWMFFLFLGAADFVMILRVWVMYNRSRLILGILLATFFCEMVIMAVSYAVYSNPRNLTEGTICQWNWGLNTQVWVFLINISQTIHGGALCILTIAQFIRQSAQMYRVAKQWQFSRYMNMLAKQGVLYFIGILLFTTCSLVFNLGEPPSGGWQFVMFQIVQSVPVITLTPRFILSIRDLYARDVRGRCGSGIDSGFGFSSMGDAGRSVVMFADVEQDEGTEDIEVMPREGRTMQLE